MANAIALPALVLIAFALASAFGLSIFVPFGFFLVMLAWGFWQVTVERTARPALLSGSVVASSPLRFLFLIFGN